MIALYDQYLELRQCISEGRKAPDDCSIVVYDVVYDGTNTLAVPVNFIINDAPSGYCYIET